MACGDDGGPAPTAPSAPPAPSVPAAPERTPDERAWVAEACRAVARVTGPRVLCIGDRPRHVDPPERLYRWTPGRRAYTLEGGAHGTHWVVEARPAADDLNGSLLRPLGTTRVRGRPARWLRGGRRSGIHAGHLVLTWREGGHRYVLSAHADSPRMRRALKADAEAMRPGGRAR